MDCGCETTALKYSHRSEKTMQPTKTTLLMVIYISYPVY